MKETFDEMVDRTYKYTVDFMSNHIKSEFEHEDHVLKQYIIYYIKSEFWDENEITQYEMAYKVINKFKKEEK